MARHESPPFGRGETFFNGGTVDSTSGENLEGMEWEFEDLDYSSTGSLKPRTNRKVRCRIVRNSSGIALLPKRLVSFKAGSFNKQVDGYANVTSEPHAYPVDEWLPAAGVPANDLFWIVVEGPAVCLTDPANGEGNSIAEGDLVVALTAANSTASGTTGVGGRIQSVNARPFTAPTGVTSTATLIQEMRGLIGPALTARTTNETHSAVLVEVLGKF